MTYDEERDWDELAEKATEYRRVQDEGERLVKEIIGMATRLVPGMESSKVLNQLIGIGDVPVEKWIQDRRAELAAGLKPGVLLSSRRKKPKKPF